VPVNVDAIIFWHVHDARKAALEITDYRQAIDRVAQTSLREMIGSSMLAALLSDRKAADEHLRDEIGAKTAGWGVSVTSVEIRDVAIPVALQDAMSRQAQAERENRPASFSGRIDGEKQRLVAKGSCRTGSLRRNPAVFRPTSAATRYDNYQHHAEPDFRLVVKPSRLQPVMDAPRT
jgi:regulator of protease activity HflC (stomatin/prohibitin superfamily)